VRKGTGFAPCNAGLALRAVVRSLAGYKGLCKRVEIIFVGSNSLFDRVEPFAPLCRVNLNEEFNELLFEIVDDCVFDRGGIEISTLHSELMQIDIFKAVEFNCPFVVNPLPDGNFSIQSH
jgi:hypothetical protein